MILILIILVVFLAKESYNKMEHQKNFSNDAIEFANKNKETTFSIDRIVFFSSCDSKNKTSSQTNFTIENLYSYTDIALFINNKVEKVENDNINEENKIEEQNTAENTLKKVKITNIKFTKEPQLGTGNLYYKNVNNFAKGEIEEKNKVQNELEFKVTSENQIDLNTPILYNNCANPITLSYINQNIKADYTMTDTQNPITYNGKLLERCGVSIESINAAISFDIEIENNKNQKYKTTVYFEIPYETEQKSIYDGSIILKKDTNFNFYRYE